MDPGDIMANSVRSLYIRKDLVQRHWCRIDNLCIVRRMGDDGFRDKGSGIEADRAAGDQIPAFDGQQIWITRPGTNEIDSHCPAPEVLSGRMLVPAFRA